MYEIFYSIKILPRDFCEYFLSTKSWAVLCLIIFLVCFSDNHDYLYSNSTTLLISADEEDI